MTKKTPPYDPEVRARPIRMVMNHQEEHASQSAAIQSIASKIGCSGETLRNRLRHAERDDGLRAGPTSEENERIKGLEREVSELRQPLRHRRLPLVGHGGESCPKERKDPRRVGP